MIIQVILTIIFFLWGITDKVLAVTFFNNTIYLGALVYFLFLLISSNKKTWSIYGFAYFLGLGADMPLIGVLPLLMLIFEYLFFFFQRFITTNNRTINFFYTGIFFALNYLFLSFIINHDKILFSLDLIFLLLIFGFFGSIASLFTKRYEG